MDIPMGFEGIFRHFLQTHGFYTFFLDFGVLCQFILNSFPSKRNMCDFTRLIATSKEMLFIATPLALIR